MSSFFKNPFSLYKTLTGADEQKKKYVEDELPAMASSIVSGDSGVTSVRAGLDDISKMEIVNGLTYGDYSKSMGEVALALGTVGLSSAIPDEVLENLDKVAGTDSGEDKKAEAPQKDHSAFALVPLALLPVLFKFLF